MDRGGREEKERKGIVIGKIIVKNNSFLHVDNLELRIIDEVSASLQLLSLPSCELTFADGGRGDPLGDDDENLLISHEPDSYTKSNQFL